MNKQRSITSLPPSPGDDRRARMVRYSITMGIRLVCIFCMLFVQGWWLLVFAAGAILLPYFAVVIANVGSRRPESVERPGHVLLADGTASSGQRETGGRPE